jgi:hypothetical protein
LSGELGERGSGEAVVLDWTGVDPRTLTDEAGIRRAYEPKLAAEMAQFAKALGPEVQATIERVRREGGFSNAIRVTPLQRFGVHGPKGVSEMYVALLSLILSSQARQTQAQLRGQIQQRFPAISVPKDWTRPLPQFAILNLREKVTALGSPYNSIKIRKGITLSALQRAVRVALNLHEQGAIAFNASITITSTTLVINGHSFKVSGNTVGKTKKYQYPEVRLRIAALTEIANQSSGD